jgi:hypothetical protein
MADVEALDPARRFVELQHFLQISKRVPSVCRLARRAVSAACALRSAICRNCARSPRTLGLSSTAWPDCCVSTSPSMSISAIGSPRISSRGTGRSR